MTDDEAKDFVKMVHLYFEKRYKLESLAQKKEAITAEPVEASVNAMNRIYAELPPNFLPPLERVVSILQQEGHKIRAKQTDDREREWKQQKGEDRRGRVEGQTFLTAEQRTEYGKRCSKAVRLLLSDAPIDKKREVFKIMENCYPNMGWALEGIVYDKDLKRRGLI